MINDFLSLAKSRITPKFRDGENYNKVNDFLNQFFNDNKIDITIIKDMKNLDTEYTFVLNELGKLLGVERPILKIGIQVSGFFQYGINGYGLAPYAEEDDALDIRPATDEEYRRLLKAASRLTFFEGTINEMVKLLNDLTDKECYIVNGRGEYDIIVKSTLTSEEKALIEFFVAKFNILTVQSNLLGTASVGTQPFQYGVTGYGTAPYIEQW